MDETNLKTPVFTSIDAKALTRYENIQSSFSASVSNAMLKDWLDDHADCVDNETNGVNYVLEAVQDLLPKDIAQHTKNWSGNIRNALPELIEIYKTRNKPKTLPITKEDIQGLLNNRRLYKKSKLIAKASSCEAESNIVPQKPETLVVFNNIPQPQSNRNGNKYEVASTHILQNITVQVDEPVSKDAKNRKNFKSAKEGLLASNPSMKKMLGPATTQKGQKRFVSPFLSGEEEDEAETKQQKALEDVDERLKHIEPKMIELIQSEIIDNGQAVGWEDIAGLILPKSVIQEAVVWPLLRPDIFNGLRRPPKGILLFGPPGTGKTLIGKCVASQSNATFFNISASSLTSKWIGDGEKMVRALFAVARCHQPAVIFIDEIDSLLTQRNDTEHEATRRIKTEFLVQFDGAATGDDERILIIGATNRPQELDEAARRRLVKRLYIPLPDEVARAQIIIKLMSGERNELAQSEIEELAKLSEGYSGADMKSLCSEAAMGPVRSISFKEMTTISADMVRPVNMSDFMLALQRVKPSVSKDDLGIYEEWNKTFGIGY